MKHFLPLLFLLPFSAAAQTDARAKAVLDGLSKKTAALKSLKATFSVTTTDARGAAQGTQRGTFLMKGAKYRITLPAQDVRSDGRTQWTYLKEAGEVQVSTPDASAADAITPMRLFSGFSSRDYNSRYLGERKVGTKAAHVVELTPVRSTQAFKKVELAVDRVSGQVVGGTVWDKSGARFTYMVTGYTPNATLADAQFVWDAKAAPGVEVVDLR